MEEVQFVKEFLEKSYAILHEIDDMSVSDEDKELIVTSILDLFLEVIAE